MKDVHLTKLANARETSRKIVKEILDFGVTENQKLDIIYMISLSLESNKCMKEIANTLKEYRKSIGEEDDDSDLKKDNKVILT